MILIISESQDLSTTQVIEWLKEFNKSYIRINYEERIKVNFIGNDINFVGQDFDFNLSEIKSVWYRRGYLNIDFPKTGNIDIDDFLNEEKKSLIEYIYQKLSEKHHLNTINNYYINKLITTDLAKKYGLVTPKSYLYSSRKNLYYLVNNTNDEYITKSICGDPSINLKDHVILSYTTKINKSSTTNENQIFPSLIQNSISKKYELRIFYMKGDFYTMAIFSQNDEKTKNDFRDFDENKPNRRVPFKLPETICEKIKLLMNKLNLDSGSIDMIVTPGDEFVFLEVNPVGQFGMTSFPCNYNVEKKIAEYL